MKDNLNKLFIKINLKKEYYKYFETSNLVIKKNKEGTKYNFYINVNDMIPVIVFEELNERINKSFKHDIKIIIESNSISDSMIADYYQYFLNTFFEDKSLEQKFEDFSYNKYVFKIKVKEKKDQLIFKTIEKEIIKKFKYIGIDIKFSFKVKEDNADLLRNNKYVVFDFETTGLKVEEGHSIIEIGAVLLDLNNNNMVEFSELIDPNKALEPIITKLTGITDEMLKGKPSEEESIKRFKDFIKDYPLVAHNADFDISFLKNAYKKYDLGKLDNRVLDTLKISRHILFRNKFPHKLNNVAIYTGVKFDEDSHHRATYDAKGTALIFAKMVDLLESEKDITKISQIDDYH